MISTGTIRAVNPTLLAQISGVTKVPQFAQPIAPVIRPQVLTDQLRGCSCQQDPYGYAGPCGLTGIPPDYGTLRGLGKGEASRMVPMTHWGAHQLRGLGKGEASRMVEFSHWGSHQLRGLGFASDLGSDLPSAGSGNISILDTIAAGASFIPGVGPVAGFSVQALTQFIKQMGAWLGLGAGRHEADLIVPTQNSLVAQLGTITNQFLTGMTVSTDQLISLYRGVWVLGVGFQEFVLQRKFSDRRASGQALNTVMPYIDGSCGYDVPAQATATPTQQGCLTWGAGTLGGPGTDGMLGALARAIVAQGGSVPTFPNLHVAANSGLPPQSVAQTTLTTATTAINQALPAGITNWLGASTSGIPNFLIAGMALVAVLELSRSSR